MAYIDDLVREWQTLAQKRKDLEDLADKIKKAEVQYQNKIMEWCDANGMTSFKMGDGSGTVSRRTTYSAHLIDAEKFAALQFDLMKAAQENAKPLANGLLMQKRPLKEGVETLIKQRLQERDLPLTIDNYIAVAAEFGIDWHSDTKLSFTKR